MSDHGTLAEAVRAVQAELPTLPKDARNPHFKSKFTPLDTIVERVGPILDKHGLVWSTFPTYLHTPDATLPALRYTLTHAATRESEGDTMPLLLVKNDPQGQGSAITYARRYALTAVLNIVADEDDDGEATRAAARGDKPEAKAPAKPKGLSVLQAAKVLEKVSAHIDNDELTLRLAAFGVDSIADLTADAAKQLVAEVGA